MEGEIRDRRAAAILREADLSPPQEIPVLAASPEVDFQASLPCSSDEARLFLAQQRVSEPGYKSPEMRLRHKFSTNRVRESRTNRNNWTFSKHEVAKTFDSLLSRTPQSPLPLPGIAQAILSHASVSSLDELWCHLHDPKLEKRTTSRFRKSRSSIVPETTWLDEVTRRNSPDYIRLLCQAGLGQEVLDRAFSLALSQHFMDAMEVLLSYGAVASHNQGAIRDRVEIDDVVLARLLLSAPNAMSVEAWRYCMEPQVNRFLTILLMCLAHRPEVCCMPLLLKALKSQNLRATAILLAYGGSPHEDSLDIRRTACMLASDVRDQETRHKFFKILIRSGLFMDDPVTRGELMKDVKSRHLPLIRTLTNAGVSLDTKPHNAFHWAVSKMDLDILELFAGGPFTSSISPALKLVPDTTSEPDMIRLLDILALRRLEGEPLHSHLTRAVRKRHIELVKKLVLSGASVEFEEAAAIKVALEKASLDILDILLRGKCSPVRLSAAIPTAMALKPKTSRLQAIKALVQKGVLAQELGVPLQTLVSEEGIVDLDAIKLLLEYGAPVDGISDEVKNCVLVAARRGNLSVLRMLCDAGPQQETFSKAIPVAFNTVHTLGQDVALAMIKLLLQRGKAIRRTAAGVPMDQTLLAAAEDRQLDIARVLVEHGADANYKTGASFKVALKAPCPDLLRTLCVECPPSQASMEAVLFTAIDPQFYTLQALEVLLSSTPSSAAILNALWSSHRLRYIKYPDMTEIVSCFLRHGLDVNLGNGSVVCFAIQEMDTGLLRSILSANPSIASMTRAFVAAASVKVRSNGLVTMRMLLEKAKSAEIGQTQAILQQTYFALAGDFAGLELVLRHGAGVDFDDGMALQMAGAAGALKTLNLLCSSRPASQSIRRACIAAAASLISAKQKGLVFEQLLSANGGIPLQDMSQLLTDSVAKFPEFTQLPILLLARRALTRFDTLEVAIETSSCDLFMLLVRSISSADTMVRVFRHARKSPIDLNRKYWIFQYLLDKGMPVPREDVSKALLDTMEADDLGQLRFTKLLVQHGADVGYKHGKAFLLALRANSVEAVKLLSQNIVDDSVANIAFELARTTNLASPLVRIEVYRCLLQWNIHRVLLYKALVENLKSDQSDISIVQLLLANGADPNENDAECFVLASQAKAGPEFRALSKHAKLSVVLVALLTHLKGEKTVLPWVITCLAQQSRTAKIDQDELLFLCLRRFPHGTALLKVLFDNGVSATATIEHSLCADWDAERCTVLIWALFSAPRIGNDTILLLLARGGSAARPAYCTPKTKTSAALGCLLDQTRIPVLQALLNLDRDMVMSYEVRGTSIGHLGVSDGTFNLEDIPDRLSLSMASLYLGNLDAFRLMDGGHSPNDGTLHTAALLALPRFVELLLETHDPNFREEEFDHMIPLALACHAKPMPWCKIANEESDFRTRQRETMRLLAATTSPGWRHRGKTVFHIALEHGVGTTKAMIEALKIHQDPERHEKYLYTDRGGKQYLPHEYVMEFVSGTETEKETLISCIAKVGFVPPPGEIPSSSPIVSDETEASALSEWWKFRG